MKKFIFIFMAVLLLAGCKKDRTHWQLSYSAATAEERAMMDVYHPDGWWTRVVTNKGYPQLSRQLAVDRWGNNEYLKLIGEGAWFIENPIDYDQLTLPDQTGVFCDYLDIIKTHEEGFLRNFLKECSHCSSKKTMTDYFKEIKGTSMGKACFPNDETKWDKDELSSVETTSTLPLVVPTPVVERNIEVVKVDNEEVLSPRLYDEIEEAVGNCKRAAIKYMSLTEDANYLTKDDYKVIMKEVMSCKRASIEAKLNEF